MFICSGSTACVGGVSLFGGSPFVDGPELTNGVAAGMAGGQSTGFLDGAQLFDWLLLKSSLTFAGRS